MLPGRRAKQWITLRGGNGSESSTVAPNHQNRAQQGQHPDNKHLHAVGLAFARVRAICVVNVFYLCVLEWSGVDVCSVQWNYVDSNYVGFSVLELCGVM